VKLFRHTNGTVFSFGFDMRNRAPEDGIVCWDNAYGKWDDNEGGGARRLATMILAPEFIIEHEGRILAYQPGLVVEMTYVGHPVGWSMRCYRADQ
jgi:hypothetical protein